MSPMSIALIIFVCIFGGALLGMSLSLILPQHHLSKESRETVMMGAGLIATMAALVLGLLISSTKSSFDAMNNGITVLGAKTILLDRILAQYGPESKDARDMLRGTVGNAVRLVWPEEKNGQAHIDVIEKSTGMEEIQVRIMGLAPLTDTQRLLQTQAVQISSDLAQLRWMLIEQRQNQFPTAFIALLGFWLTVLFTSFGLFAPRNATVCTVLCICALSVSGALFLILEMNNPLEGMIKVSSAPLHKTLELLGK
jgi:hypothetical protein